MTVKHKSRKVDRAWLVTWESIGDHAEPENRRKVVALLSARMGAEKVRALVEKLYYSQWYTPWDMVNVVNRKPYTLHPAEFRKRQGVPWEGEILCGDNPFLKARYVRNFKVIKNEDGAEELKWDEIPVTKPPTR